MLSQSIRYGFASDQVLLGSKTNGGGAMTIASGIPVVNPPTEVAVAPPTDQDFENIYKAFFGGDYVNITRRDGLGKLAEHVRNETSNGLFAKLKVKERDFHGHILVTPTTWKERHEQIIIISARILYIEKGVAGIAGLFAQKDKKMLRSEEVLIYFNDKGIYEKVFMGVGTSQEIGGG